MLKQQWRTVNKHKRQDASTDKRGYQRLDQLSDKALGQWKGLRA